MPAILENDSANGPAAGGPGGGAGVGSRIRLLAGAVVVAFLLGELLLRLAGFRFQFYPEKIEFGWPDPQTLEKYFQPDRQLLWVPPNYEERVQRGMEQRPPLVLLGCSVTQAGRYDRRLSDLVSTRYPGRGIRYLNLGVGGWSSYQGLEQLKRDVLGMSPRVITVFFGWNDHWKSFGLEDKMVAGHQGTFLYALRDLRLVQLLQKSAVALQVDRHLPLRVSAEDFRNNLRNIVRLARDGGILPMLLTAPTSIEKGREPAYLAERHVERVADIVPLHRRYADIVREVAAEEGAPLCDLAAAFEALPGDGGALPYLMADGIHTTARGDGMIGEILLSCFEAQGLLKEGLLLEPIAGVRN